MIRPPHSIWRNWLIVLQQRTLGNWSNTRKSKIPRNALSQKKTASPTRTGQRKFVEEYKRMAKLLTKTSKEEALTNRNSSFWSNLWQMERYVVRAGVICDSFNKIWWFVVLVVGFTGTPKILALHKQGLIFPPPFKCLDA